MDIIGDAIRNLEDPDFQVRSISRSEWVSQKDLDGMRDEMRSRIANNTAYRNRSARAMQNITVR